MQPIDVSPTNLDTVRQILGQHVPELEVRAFGSRVGWTARETSDLDLALMTADPLNIARRAALKAAFTKSDLPFRVDIVDWASTSESFRKVIEREHVVLVEREELDSGGDWSNMPFSDAVLINPPVPLERGKTYPFVDMAAVSVGSRSVYSSDQRSFRSGGSRFENGDTLMARITPCLENGKVARYHPCSGRGSAHGSTEFIVIRGRPNVTDPAFAYYLTQWEEVRNYAIGQMTGTSGRQRVPIESLDHLMVSIPSLPEQRIIAHILATLDDKIELNRRMNETLEAMARALFKSWFVDFDPVRAKMEGRDPGLPQDIADLFPDRLVDSEMGEIPEGWEVKALGKFGDVITGKTPSTRIPEFYGDDVPFLKIPDMRGKMYVIETRNMLSSVGASSQALKTLPSGSISVSCIATPGLVVLNHRNIQTNQQINSIVPRDRSLSKYLYWSCRQLSADIKTGGLGGSVFGNMKKSIFSALLVLNPASAAIRAFDQFASPMHSTILANEEQGEILAQVRDTLLPKLISGEIPVQDAEKALESVP